MCGAKPSATGKYREQGAKIVCVCVAENKVRSKRKETETLGTKKKGREGGLNEEKKKVFLYFLFYVLVFFGWGQL